MRVDYTRAPSRVWKRSFYHSTEMRNPGCVAQGIHHVLWLHLANCNLHMGVKYLESSFLPCEVVKPMGWKSGGQFQVFPSQRTHVERSLAYRVIADMPLAFVGGPEVGMQCSTMCLRLHVENCGRVVDWKS